MVRLKFIHLLNSYELLSLNLVLWGNGCDGCVCKRIINWSGYMGLLSSTARCCNSLNN